MKKIFNQKGFAITAFLYSIFLLVTLFLILILLVITNNSIGYFKFQASVKNNLDEISYDKTEINDYAKITFEEESPIIQKGETFNLLEGVKLIRYDGTQGEITNYSSVPNFDSNITGKYIITYQGIIDGKNFTKKRVITVKEFNHINEILFSNIKTNNSINIDNNNTTIKYSNTTIKPTIYLSKTDSNSSITFDVIVDNNTNDGYIFNSISYDEATYNDNITFDLINLKIGDIISKGESLKFQIKFYYNQNININEENFDNILKTTINFNFLKTPILELNNENELYTINNIYPGYSQEFEFEISNYNTQQINKVPATYFINNTQTEPFTIKIYNTNGEEVIEGISLEGDGETKITHKYTLKISWEYKENIDYSNYENQKYSIQTLIKAVPDNEEYLDDYSLKKEFNTNISVAPFYFSANTENSATIINDTTTLAVNINNYASNTEYNVFDTNYEVSIEGNENFTFSINGITATNNSITIQGQNANDNNFNIVLNADITNLNTTENLNLKITSTKPYYKTITFPLTIKLHPVVVTLNANGGTVSPSTITVYNGKQYTNLPTLTRAGYTFKGWYSAQTGGTKYATTKEVTTSNTTQTLYAQWTPLLLSNYVSVGDYVSYPIYYTNVATKSTGDYIPKDTYVGWRVLSNKDEDGDGIKEVRLISAGVPMTYVFAKTDTLSTVKAEVKKITTNFFSTGIASTSTNGKFFKNGFYKLLSDGTQQKITSISALKTAFTNKYTETNSSGVPLVQSITKSDVDTIVGKTTTDGTAVTGYNNLLAIPVKDVSGKYASYYISGYNSYSGYYHLWDVYNSGAVVGTQGEQGIRPVVTLKDTVVKTGGSGTSASPYTIDAE